MQSVQCLTCVHYLGVHKCKAFDDIPDEILQGLFDHTEPYEDDNGIRYEPIDD